MCARVVYHSVAAPYVPAMPHHLAKAEAEDARATLVRRVDDRAARAPTCRTWCPCSARAPTSSRCRTPLIDPFGLVDLADVAEATAGVLLDDGHVGATYELGGPALVTVADVARRGRRGARAPDRGAAARPRGLGGRSRRGVGDRERAGLLAMYRYYDEHGLPAGGRVLRALLGGRSTALRETLARELAALA